MSDLQTQLNEALAAGDVTAISHIIRAMNAENVAAYRAMLAPHTAYGEWCRRPEACIGKGYCPLDPTCAD